ncbi:MAG TPA: SHOCT domain-containing protein [Candidatus Saccharimonadales bacterium]
MYHYGPMMNGSDWGWGIIMMFFWLLVLVAVAVVVMHLHREHNHHHHAGDIQKSDPVDIVKERYAKGGITKEQFEQLKKDLK